MDNQHLEEVAQLRLAVEIMGILNDPGSVAGTIKSILALIKKATEYDAVGVRLKNDNDFPYFAHEGFTSDFLLMENSLISVDANGGGCKDADGNYCLECTCGVVIRGKTDPSNPLFTVYGSAWTNNSLPILDIPAELDPRLNPRNRCVHDGYLSVALVPITSEGEIVGLLQLNDSRPNRFTLEIIHFFEGISASIGVALMRKQMVETLERERLELRKALDEITTLQGIIPICAWCKKIRDDKGYWEKLESYIAAHTQAEFSHGICPECAVKMNIDISLEKETNHLLSTHTGIQAR